MQSSVINCSHSSGTSIQNQGGEEIVGVGNGGWGLGWLWHGPSNDVWKGDGRGIYWQGVGLLWAVGRELSRNGQNLFWFERTPKLDGSWTQLSPFISMNRNPPQTNSHPTPCVRHFGTGTLGYRQHDIRCGEFQRPPDGVTLEQLALCSSIHRIKG